MLVGGLKTDFPLDLALSLAKLIKGDFEELSNFMIRVVLGGDQKVSSN